MKPINKVRKIKERLLFILDDIKELESFPFSKYLPKEAKRVEVTCKKSRGERILEIDYVLEISSEEIKLNEE